MANSARYAKKWPRTINNVSKAMSIVYPYALRVFTTHENGQIENWPGYCGSYCFTNITHCYKNISIYSKIKAQKQSSLHPLGFPGKQGVGHAIEGDASFEPTIRRETWGVGSVTSQEV